MSDIKNIKLEKLIGLDLSKYPQEYKDYIKEETKCILDLVKGTKKLLDVGCGSDIAIIDIAKNVTNYIGIENDDILRYQSKDKVSELKNVAIEKYDVHQLTKKYLRSQFDVTICLWNGFGSMGDEQHFLDEVAKVTKGKIILSLVEKGYLDDRCKYYEDMNSTYLVMDDGKETIASPIWGYSRAFSQEDIEKYVNNSSSKLKVDKFIKLAKIGLLAVISKK